MTPGLTLSDLDPRDILVLWDALRHGALTDYQILRRYGGSEAARPRLQFLLDENLIEPLVTLSGGTPVYRATPRGFSIGRFGLERHIVTAGSPHLGHDLAVVDLADYLLNKHPAAKWCAEFQIFRELNRSRNGRRIDRRDYERRPDGLLVDGNGIIAVELEHSLKSRKRYWDICHWFAAEIRVAQVWWFTDSPAIERAIREVNRDLKYDRDIPVRYEPFPPGVVVRDRLVRPLESALQALR